MNDRAIMLQSALFYHSEGLCVIPIVPRDKRPALPSWEYYQTNKSTQAEITEWFTTQPYNIGIIHGEVSGGYIAVDIDHDKGIFKDIKSKFPQLTAGRIEQSGSLEGYHLPLRVGTLPGFGSRTWKTKNGIVNIRVRNCQTVAPPSIHPSGVRYRFMQKGKLLNVPDIASFIGWLDDIAEKPKRDLQISKPALKPIFGDSLIDAVKREYTSVLQVFAEWGITNNVVPDRKGELRLLGWGGLLVTEDHQQWYCFSDEVGGGIFEAWGWCKYGTGYDKCAHFREVLFEMAEAKNIDTTDYKKEAPSLVLPINVNTQRWASQYKQYWERLR